MYTVKRVNSLFQKPLKNKVTWGFKIVSKLKRFDLPQIMPQMYSYYFLLNQFNSIYILLILFVLVWNNKK